VDGAGSQIEVAQSQSKGAKLSMRLEHHATARVFGGVIQAAPEPGRANGRDGFGHVLDNAELDPQLGPIAHVDGACGDAACKRAAWL